MMVHKEGKKRNMKNNCIGKKNSIKTKRSKESGSASSMNATDTCGVINPIATVKTNQEVLID